MHEDASRPRRAIRDCFICHATEDKDAIARPVAESLLKAGFKVWFDEFEVGVGDSLSEAIDEGLATSRFGVVVLSPQFFEKKWTKRELAGLTAKEVVGDHRVILPVWHGVDEKFLLDVSPPLADRVAVKSSAGLDAVVARMSKQWSDCPEMQAAAPERVLLLYSLPPPRRQSRSKWWKTERASDSDTTAMSSWLFGRVAARLAVLDGFPSSSGPISSEMIG
jgi:TIR domain